VTEKAIVFTNLRSLARVAHKACFDCIDGVDVTVGGILDGVLGVGDRVQLLDRVQRGKGRTAVDHLIKNAAQRPDIAGSA